MTNYNDLDYVFEESLQVCNLINEAQFQILPKFKADPKTKKIAENLEKAADVLKEKGTDNKQLLNKNLGAMKDSRAAISDICGLISSASFGIGVGIAVNPLLGIAVSILWHAYMRFARYAIDQNNEVYAANHARKQAAELKNISKKLSGKEKKEIDDLIKKLEDSAKELEESNDKKKKEKGVKEFVEYNELFESVIGVNFSEE